MRRAVFLDRDGVVLRSIERDGKPFAPTKADQFEILPGVEQAVARLKQAGFVTVLVTNQPDVGRGTLDQAIVEGMHDRLQAVLALDEVKVSYTASDDEGCQRRKPAPGMLLEAARRFDIDLGRSYMVGDRWRDVEAGKAAGCVTIFIDHGYQERQPSDFDLKVSDLPEAVSFILAN
ncbi:MAG: D-glycero-D-manno-heptose 1 7-bisphosphate [Rhodospirillaceae bacterium]|nr:MAG: D-glycero-D-manno-heptose 1 7-bisphosphate [Rhodospirillaceae bacterium]TNC97427.1 MAG: D-glycero-D-manno-heptose 1,7-bisphosphate phosphatase [Stygiobacter sp.]